MTIRRKLTANFLSLAFLQGMNYVLPFITMPYLLRILGSEKFGLLAFAVSIITFFQIAVDYGFNVAATKEVAIHRGNIEKLKDIYADVISAKILIATVSFFALYALVFSVDRLTVDASLYIYTFGIVIGSVFLPTWFFQGLEEMWLMSFFSFLAKLASVALTFAIVKNESDYAMVPIINSATMIVVGIAALVFVQKRYGIRLRLSRLDRIGEKLREGWHIFVSTFGINIYINSNALILGIFAGNVAVGYYAIAEKTIFLLRGVAGVLFGSIFSHVCRLSANISELRIFFFRLFAPIGVVFFVFGILTIAFSADIVSLVAGKYIREADIALSILAFTPFVVIMNIPAYQTLLAYNLKSSYTIVLLSGAALNIALNTILCGLYGSGGTATSVLATEIFITFALYAVLELRHKEYSILTRRDI